MFISLSIIQLVTVAASLWSLMGFFKAQNEFRCLLSYPAMSGVLSLRGKMAEKFVCCPALLIGYNKEEVTSHWIINVCVKAFYFFTAVFLATIYPLSVSSRCVFNSLIWILVLTYTSCVFMFH